MKATKPNQTEKEAEASVVPLAPRMILVPRATGPSKGPSVYDFLDAIDFITAALQAFKSRNPGFSQRALARVLGVSSPGFFNLVLNRKRPLGESLGKEVERFFLAREILRPGEENYFQGLVRLGLAQTEDERSFLRDSLMHLKYDREHYLLSVQEMNALQRWEAIALQEAVEMKSFHYNPQFLYKLFRGNLPAHEAVFMAEHLVRKGLLEHSNGTLKRAKTHIQTPSDIPSETIRSLHRQFLQEALKCLDATKVEEREYSTYTMCVDKSKLPEAKALIREFSRKLARLMETSQGDAVFQLNVQLFPILGEADEK